MALAPGTRLGAYEILAPLGAGGMGEVYRARDSRLNRDVALKILAPHLVGDDAAVARFEREARTASALNHPHIVHIYDIGDFQTTAGPTRYLAMELVAGETLRTRMSLGVQTRQIVGLLAQVADALAKAHSAGIVHRDLKPENIMVTYDGYAKVVDFGLAKLIEAPTFATTTDTPLATMADAQSRTVSIVGTVGYMAPEQVQGQPTDGRADIFSLGCVLYESLAGRQPFKGASALATLQAIVEDDPPPLAALHPAPLPELQRIVARCLAKDPGQRYQAAMDVAHDLRAFSQTPAGANGDFVSRRAARRLIVVGSLVGAAILSAITIGVWQRRDSRPADAAASGSGIRIEKLTNRGTAGGPAISADGRYIAYSAPDDTGMAIWLRDIGEKTETRLVSGLTTDVGVAIRFGERGRALYYAVWSTGRDSWTLYTIPLLGGQPRSIAGSLGGLSPGERHMAFSRTVGAKRMLFIGEVDTGVEREVGDVTDGGPLAWSRDGSTLLFTRSVGGGHALSIINADGTSERQLQVVSQRPQGAVWNVAGTAVVYSVSRAANDVQLVGLDVATGKSQPVGDRIWRDITLLGWLPDGRRFVATEFSRPGVTPWLVSYPDGTATRILADTRTYYGASLTADGTRLATVEFGVRSDVLVSPDPPAAGSFRRIASGTDVSHSLCWTPDGRMVYSSNDAGSYDLYVMNADGSGRRQLTFDRSSNEIEPAATPDGRSVIFVSDHSGERGLSRIELDGTGLKRLTSPAPDRGDREPQVTADNKWIIYRNWDNGPSLWKMPIDGGAPALVRGKGTSTRAGFEEAAYGGSASPDGRMLAFFHYSKDLNAQKFTSLDIAISSADGRIIKRFPYRDLVMVGDDERIQWSPDGRAIYYRFATPASTNLWKQSVAGGAPVQVTHFDDRLQDFDWSFDGKKLAVSRRTPIQDIVLISNFR